MKLPKQWMHWCEKSGLKSSIQTRRHYGRFYLSGHGRHWRLNCHGMFQCGDKYSDFDKWARCDIEEVPMPTSLHEFKGAVKLLLEKQNAKDVGK